MNHSKVNIRLLACTAMFSAISVVLMYLEIPLPVVSFIAFDFSDLPALISSFAFGPVSGVVVCLIKNLIHLAVSKSMFIGEIANFATSAVFVLVAGFIYKYHKTRKGAIIATLAGALAMGIFSFPVNYFIVYPLYFNFFPYTAIMAIYQKLIPSATHLYQALLFFNVPYTILKGLVISLITFLIYKPLSPILKGRSKRTK